MGLDALLNRMQGRESVTPVTPCYPAGVTAKPAPDKACTLVTPVTPQIINSEPANETPSQQEQADLARLVARVCRAYDCHDAEISQAIETALADYCDALTCYTDLAKQAGMTLNDDRRMCFECAELSGSYCMAARRGEIKGADRRYEPMPYQPKRCDKFNAR